MEVALLGTVLSAVVKSVVPKLMAVMATRSTELGNLAGGISSLRTELAMIASEIEAMQNGGRPSGLQLVHMTTMSELAFEIEDCLDRFLPCAACERGAVSIPEVHDFAAQVGGLMKRLTVAHQQIQNHGANIDSQQASAVACQSAAGTESVDCSQSVQVGIEEPKQEILGLLRSENLEVISIVGFGGSGKTQLAKAVYNCPEVEAEFGLRAWAVASKDKGGGEVLLAILQDLSGQEPLAVPRVQEQVPSFKEQMRVHLDQKLQQTRCLIVIDDIKMHHWITIKSFFSGLTIKILLTTTVQPVANTSTVDKGYIYNMRSLSKEDSKGLLNKMVPMLLGPSRDLAVGSDAIVHKCHGHPLALTCVANYLGTQAPLTGKVCQEASRYICSDTDENQNEIFTELRQLLVNNYTDLPGNVRTCLLYASLFPNGRPVSRKTLTSRWLAEGYIPDGTERSAQKVADKYLKELMDRQIIRPVDASNSGEPKTCKPHGVMHQFMLYQSISSNFIATSLTGRGNSRHLVIENHRNRGPAASQRNALKKLLSCFHPSTSRGCRQELRPRSVTVFGSAEEDVYSDLLKCELLRVLDLNECNDSLSKRHRKYIYKLLHLKYLTLGKSVSKIDDEMKNLHCLETLDLRKADIITVPEEVISLPHLAHLFGKIKIKKVGFMNRRKFSLQTLAGVVVDNKSGFPELMDDMKQLTRVKIWCEITSTDSNNYTLLSNAIHHYSTAGIDTPDNPRSLSLHLNHSSRGLLRGDDGQEGFLSALKLQGRPTKFSEFVLSLSALQELCLTSISLTDNDLQALCTLELLVCLKLVQDKLGGLHINPTGFQSLQRLCLVVTEPKFPTIAQGALPSLTSIQLLCRGLANLGSIKIEYFTALCEVALDSTVHHKTKTAWQDEAKKHPRRPNVVFLKKVDQTGTRSSVKYVATDQTHSGSHVQGTP